MENFTQTQNLGPLYFFDQVKAKRKTWGKGECEDLYPNVRRTSRISTWSTLCEKYGEQDKAVLSKWSAEEEYELYSFNNSQIHHGSADLSRGNLLLKKNTFEEYKLIAAEILSELEETFQKYADYNITFPMGAINLVDYSWRDLTEGFYEYSTKALVLRKHQDSFKYPESKDIVDSKKCKVLLTHSAGDILPEDSYQLKGKGHHPGEIRKNRRKKALDNPKEIFSSAQDHESAIIRFSLSSKAFLENGWIFHPPRSPLNIPEALLSTAVKKLHVIRLQIEKEEDQLKREGFTRKLTLRHYTDTADSVNKIMRDHQPAPCFWLELLQRKTEMPIFEVPSPNMKKFHYTLIDGSSITYQNISMMFNHDGGMVMNKKGNIIREWIWPSSGKLDDPVEVKVNRFITMKISGRFAITLVYIWLSESLKLSLAPVKCKSFPPCVPQCVVCDGSFFTEEARTCYKMKCLQNKTIAQSKDSSRLTDLADIASYDADMDISPMFDLEIIKKLRRLQRTIKKTIHNWLDYYRFTMGVGSVQLCKAPVLLQKMPEKQKASLERLSLEQSAKENDLAKEQQRYRNTFLRLKGFFHPTPCIQRTPAPKKPFRLPTSFKGQDTSQLACPEVLRRMLCGQEMVICRCSTYNIPEVTDLEYDHLICDLLASEDQIIIVYVFSAQGKDKTINEVAKIYRKLNRSRGMPCIQSHSDPFRLLKYNILSATKFTGSQCPLLVQRHNVIPGIFLMYIQGKLLFANFIFNGYSTSAIDFQKQIVKTRKDYDMGYFLPKDFRIW